MILTLYLETGLETEPMWLESGSLVRDEGEGQTGGTEGTRSGVLWDFFCSYGTSIKRLRGGGAV